MADVTFSNVMKRFDDGTTAVNDLNISIAEGEFLVLVGPSGCGKSTSLRMVAGLEEITGGEISIDGKVINGLTPRERDIAMVFQTYALYPHMTVEQNMGFPLRMAKMDAAERRKRVRAAAEILDIDELLDRHPRELSGGQRQRVAMGRAIVREPRVFLMDEPLSNLDAKLRIQMRAEIARLQRRLGTTTIYVTHDQVEAMTLGDRVAVMHDGVLQQFAEPSALYEAPETVFVAGFVGSPPMNICRAKIEKGPTGLSVRFGDMTLGIGQASLDKYPAVAERVGQEIVMGTRPEAFFVDSGEVPEDQRIRAKVDLVEMLGAEAMLYLHTDAEPAGGAFLESPDDERSGLSGAPGGMELVARVSPYDLPKDGEMVDLRYDTGVLHFFDPETGHALW